MFKLFGATAAIMAVGAVLAVLYVANATEKATRIEDDWFKDIWN